MKVPLLDLKAQYNSIREEILKVTQEVYESQYFILGPKVEALEKEISEYCSSKYAIGVTSGTDALLISLIAANIGHEDIVITTPYTFFATAGSIARTGAVPVFVDIDPDTYNISTSGIESTVSLTVYHCIHGNAEFIRYVGNSHIVVFTLWIKIKSNG